MKYHGNTCTPPTHIYISIQLATELKDVIFLNVIKKKTEFDYGGVASWKVGREPGDGITRGVGVKSRW